MAGFGPAPKPAGRRARRNAEPPSTVLRFEPCEQPPLPDTVPWPPETQLWWRTWGSSPLSEHFTVVDWMYLMDTAWLHAKLWGNNDTTVLAELRIRLAKFFATPEDRARGRIVFSEADDADDGFGSPSAAAARERRAKVRAVGSEG